MFGLKIRSWMENHIVRPRKKGNKNKNGNSGNLVTSINNTQNGHKGISSNQGESSVVGSPARRSEVSPIQNHTTSRFGWHSPNDDELCKIDQSLPYMVKTSTYSPKVRPMNSKTINRSSGGSSHEKTSAATSPAPYSRSVDAKYYSRAFDYTSSVKLSPRRDNSAVLRAVSASASSPNTSCFATASRLNKYRYHHQPSFETHEMFEQQTQPQPESNKQQNTFGKYEKEAMFSNGCGTQHNNATTIADDGENNQMVAITLNGANAISAQQKQRNIVNNKRVATATTTKMSHIDKTSNHQQSSMVQNYHNNHLDYRSGSQMSFYDNQCTDDELHRQHYFGSGIVVDKQYHYKQQQQQQQMDSMHSSSDASSKSEKQMQNISPQQNGFRMKSKNQPTNNNDCERTTNISDDTVPPQRKPNQMKHQYGKILNATTKLTGKDHRNETRPIPMLPSPPSTPPPPLNAKIKDYHESSNKFYQDYQLNMHLSNQQQNRFNGKGNGNINNNNEKSSSNINNNANGFEFYSNGCSNASTKSTSLSKQSTATIHGNGIDENNGVHKELIQSRAKCKQAPARTNNHSNGQGTTPTATHLTPTPSNHQLAHVINSLSSPESAYSTGYSTDGTSPSGTGTTNAPEYYINMRTGTHYFPRGVNAVAVVERSRQKFGLNKIEETAGETICTTSITNVTSNAMISNHRRTESCDLSYQRHQTVNNIFSSQIICNSSNNNNKNTSVAPIVSKEVSSLLHTNTHSSMSPDLPRHLAYQTYRGFESPSPRQRSRIKTNPWLSGPDTNSMLKKMDIDTSSTSSGIKSSSDAGTDDKKSKNHISSESESSSSTEIEVSRKSFSPNTVRKRKLDKQLSERLSNRVSNCCDSDDEDATFNELMGKFDESYIYEKETDILSDDSDPTECASDLDTGQDGGDECETDELLDIDFIDTGSIQEVTDKEIYKNTGSCTYYHNNQAIDKRQNKLRKSRKQQSEDSNGSQRRRKRLTRTRKRNSESRDGSQTSNKTSSPHRFRESRSVGGTPVSLRRNKSDQQYQSTPKMVPLSSRCNSLTFTEIHSIRSRFLAIAESEKALLKADIEADVKYKQLIHEAETILVSMKTTALRDTPVPSPSRRVCNVPANKRVEMLRNCEADLRRELLKTQSKPTIEVTENLNRKESFETLTTPSSPVKINYANGNGGRFSPRKTHLTNFINQNITPVELMRRPNSTDMQNNPSPATMEIYETKMKRSPCLQFNTTNNRTKITPPRSPMPRRRFRSQSPRICIESDSDSDTLNGNSPNQVVQKRPVPIIKRGEINRNKENKLRHTWRKSRQSVGPDDILNQNTIPISEVQQLDATDHRPFRSIDMAHHITETFYCPQSEPLKRKIYSEKTLDRLQKSLEMESEIPRKAILQKISNLRRDRQQKQQVHRTSNSQDLQNPSLSSSANVSESDLAMLNKRQLILNTIEDLKRNLEDQSVELCGLNDDEE